MYSLTSGTYLIHNFPSLACIPLPLAHTYFFIFLFSHVFLCFWHIPISSFFSFRMCSLASGTFLFHLFSLFACVLLPLAHSYFIFFLFSHVFPRLWHIPISSFFSFRMCSLTSGTFLIHNFPSLACILLPPAHSYFIFFLFSHVFSYLRHIPISSFFSFRMYSLAAGTFLIHNFTLSHMYSLTSGTYLIHNFPSLACIPLPPAHTYFIISPSLTCILLPPAHT